MTWPEDPAYYGDGSPFPAAEPGAGDERVGRPFRETDLSVLIRDGVPPPDLLCGDLLYAGGLHSITGPPDSGKTTIALWWMIQHVRTGQHVMFLDEEGGAELVAEKLIALDVTAEEATRIHYYPFPARTWDQVDVYELRETVDRIKPGVMLWDSSAAVLSRAGLDENSAADVTKFWAQVLTPVAREHGTAVLVIDHDGKTGETSRYSRGSGAKLAACDVAFKVTIDQPFSRLTDGLLKMHVSKDRRGWLHRDWEITVQTGGGCMVLSVSEAVAGEDGEMSARPLKPAEQKILDTLTIQPVTLGQLNDQLAAIHGRPLTRETASRALAELARRGLATKQNQGPGRVALWGKSPGQPVTVTPPH